MGEARTLPNYTGALLTKIHVNNLGRYRVAEPNIGEAPQDLEQN